MPNEAFFFDQSDRAPVEYRPLQPVIIKGAEIEREIERLAALDVRRSRRSLVVHPGLLEGMGLMPSCTVSINVLMPGERTRPHRHNSSVVNFCMRGSGTSIIAGREVHVGQYDVWTTPPWAIHQHVNDTDELQVRFSYSNASLLDRLHVHVVDDTDGLDPYEPLGDPDTAVERSERGVQIGPDDSALLSYEQLISPEPPPQAAKHWPWPEVARHLYPLKETRGKEYEGRRLFLLYDPITGRAQGTTSTFFATMAILPSGQVDVPHRHTSAAINYYFQGRGWSIVGGQRYEWESGDLMLSAPGWMPHGHAADEEVLALTIQDSPLQISLGSLLWVENLKDNVTAALGVTKGFDNSESRSAGVLSS